jgi:hypothetical protein
MLVDEYDAKSKTKGVKSWPTCIFDTIYKCLDVLMDDFLKHLHLSHNFNHKIKVVFGLAPPSKSPY